MEKTTYRIDLTVKDLVATSTLDLDPTVKIAGLMCVWSSERTGSAACVQDKNDASAHT